MTPKELRENAQNKIRSAKALIEAGSPDEAANLCGQAVEIVLKARFATRNHLTDFPKDVKELKKIKKEVATHDLDVLLRLAEGEEFDKGTCQHVDWDQAMDWEPSQRYDPVGTKTLADAEAQLVETQRLYDELSRYELVEKLVDVERRISDEMGPFIWFGLVRDAFTPGEWAIVASGWWAKEEHEHKRALILIQTQLNDSVDSDLFCQLPILALHPRDPYMQPLLVLGPLERSPRRIRMTSIVLVGVGLVSDAFVVTSYWRPDPDRTSGGAADTPNTT